MDYFVDMCPIKKKKKAVVKLKLIKQQGFVFLT